jgi:ribulose-phosphate 3-epimerase
VTVTVAPSILAADHGRLREQVEAVVAAGARVIHVDVMDGHFVPPLALGPGVVAALRDLDVELDVHLMVERPERTQIDAFAQAGAHAITVHAEATPHLDFALSRIREHGCRAGLAVTPSTPLEVFGQVACDVALVMSVNPGWGGQAFIPGALDRIAHLRALLGPDVPIEVDGGVDEVTIGPAVEAGATLLVAGSSVFGGGEPAVAYERLVAAARALV